TASIPDVWYLHAKFDHVSHRAVDCRQCHKNAYAFETDGTANPHASTTHKDVLVPGVANCRMCHSPSRTEGGLAVGGARSDCTECHRYHHGDRPLQGIGAWELGPKNSVDVQGFLRGARQ